MTMWHVEQCKMEHGRWKMEHSGCNILAADTTPKGSTTVQSQYWLVAVEEVAMAVAVEVAVAVS